MNRRSLHNTIKGYAFLLPSLLIVFFVMFYPVIFTFRLSFMDYTLQFNRQKFVGLENYINLIKDASFRESIYRTFIFTIATVFLELVLGFAIALFANGKFKGNSLLRTVMLIPWAIPTVISSVLWKFMLNDQFGFINFVFNKLKIINSYKSWLAIPQSALNATIVIDVWKTTPFVFILLLAGLQTIPKEEYEAANIDGANFIQRFVYITLPQMGRIIITTLLFRTMDAFRVFDMVVNLTNGGPGNATEYVTLYAYKTIFRKLNVGYGSTISIVIFFIIVIFSSIYLKMLGDNLVVKK
jgi:multiple sugar transport system permease protein